MIAALVALVLATLGYGVIVPQLPALAGTDDPAVLSALFAAYAIAKIGAQVPGGVLVDRFGARAMILYALALHALATSVFALGAPPLALIAARVGQGLALGVIYPAVFATAAAGSHGTTGRRLGVVGGAAAAGTLAGFALAGGLAPVWGARVPVALVAAAAPLGAVVVLVSRAGPRRPPASRGVAAELGSLRALAGAVPFLALALPVLFNKLSFTGYQAVLPVLGPDLLAIETRGVTGLFALAGVVSALAQPVGGRLADRYRFERGLALAVPVQLAGMVVTGFADDVVAFGVGLALYVTGTSIVFAFAMRGLARVSGAGRHGAAFGAFATLTDTATIVGPAIALAGYAAIGAPWLAALTGLGVVSAVTGAWLSRRGGSLPDCAEPRLDPERGGSLG